MIIKLALIIFITTSINAFADTTLRCNANNKCDAYARNCNVDPYSFSVNIDPKKSIVTMGSRAIKADFSNPAVVEFDFLEYKYIINKFDYSALLFNNSGMRNGSCVAVNPAW